MSNGLGVRFKKEPSFEVNIREILRGYHGFSPIVTIEAIEGGNRVNIETADGMHSFDIMDGEDWIPSEGELESIAFAAYKKAKPSIDAAVEKANKAADEADDAREGVEDAIEEANKATENANTAADSANEAASAANAAKDAANTAANAANEAKDAANTAAENADKVAEDIQRRAESGAFNGKNGKDGKPGEPGKDWIPTDAELNAIANDAAEKLQPTISEIDGELRKQSGEIANQERTKVGYSEVVNGQLLMYSDATKSILLATLDLPSGGSTDVQINGTSITQDGVANIPKASEKILGAVAIGSGITINANGEIGLNIASETSVQRRTAGRPIDAYMVNSSVKAALTDSNKMVLTDTEKAAACQTIGADGGEWVKLLDKEYKEAFDATEIVYVDKPYKRFVMLLYSPQNPSANMYFQLEFKNGKIANVATTASLSDISYAYGVFDLDGGTIQTAIRGNNTGSTLNLYGTHWDSMKNFMESLVYKSEVNRVWVTGYKPVGTKIAIYAR